MLEGFNKGFTTRFWEEKIALAPSPRNAPQKASEAISPSIGYSQAKSVNGDRQLDGTRLP